MGRGLSDYRKGLLLTAAGVLVLTPDSLLVRLVDAAPWTLLFWRGFLMSIGFSAFLIARKISVRRLQGRGLLASVFLASSTTCFVFSLEHCSVAQTLLILATSPLLAALLAWLFLKENPSKSTLAAILICLGGVALSLAQDDVTGSILGVVFAFGSALSMAAHFTALRWWNSADSPLAVWAAGWMVALGSLPFASTLVVDGAALPYLGLLGLIVLPVAFGLMALGPKYLPAAEVSLLLLLETVLGPFWVWLALRERPSDATLVGAAIVVVTISTHALVRQQAEHSALPE